MYKKLSYLILFTVLFGVVEAQAAQFEWIRAAFCDTRYPGAWAGVGTATRDALAAAGYTVLNADELKTWMQARIADKKYSVVVFCQDAAPDTVTETQSADCTLRKYLDAGGKIVWYGDIPFYYVGHVDGTTDAWQDNGAVNVLGIAAVNVWSSGNTVTITPIGARWGLTQKWSSLRTIAANTANIEVLATDNGGNAAAWVKHFVKGDKFRGFVRFYDTDGGQANISIADIMSVAEYAGLKASNPQPANGAADAINPILQWSTGNFVRTQNLYFGTDPNLPEVAHGLPSNRVMWFYPDPAGLIPGTTYYWRVDTVESDGTVRTGDLWHFTAQSLKASVPNPADGATGLFPGATLSWLSGRDGLSARVYFGSDKTAVANGDPSTDKGPVAEASFTDVGELRASTTYYWRVDTVNLDTTVVPGDVWSFSIMDAGPANKIVFELWSNIAGTAISALTSSPRYPGSPDAVEYMDSWLHPADAAPDADWGSNYGARMYGWLKPPATGDYTFWIAGDDEQQLLLSTDASPANAVMIANVTGWTPALDFDNTGGGSGGASQKSAAINLKAGQKYYIMSLGKEGGGGDSTAVAWQGGPITTREVIKAQYVDTFSLPPLQAFRPSPAKGAVDTFQTLTLTWSAGDKAKQHAVYLGDDANAVASADTSSPLFKGERADASFTTDELEWGQTYYWRVDEVSTGEAGSPWKGSVWSFTTANYILIDDFESYTDEEVGRIFQTWIDGWGYTTPPPGNKGNGTGSTVGYIDAPYAEQTIVHGGKQSMPMGYDNANNPNYSEAERTFDSPQDWTAHGMNTLSLWVRGYPAAPNDVTVTETGGKMSLTGAGTDLWGTSDQFTYAYKTLNGDATIIARVDSNGVGTNRWAKGGVMIRQSLSGNSAHAMMVLTGGDGNGGAFQNRASAGLDQNANDAASNTTVTTRIAPPYWVKLERVGNAFTASISANGTNWTMVGTHDVVMSDPVYIGLCVTSHQAGEQRTYQFSGIQTTGSVTGAWQGAVITSPYYNSTQDLYVAIQDSTSKIAVVEDATVVNATDWVQVKMPLSGFTTASPSKVTKMFIGVGDRKNPVAGGAGMLFIDDIRVIKE